jgi:hypothetical protein
MCLRRSLRLRVTFLIIVFSTWGVSLIGRRPRGRLAIFVISTSGIPLVLLLLVFSAASLAFCRIRLTLRLSTLGYFLASCVEEVKLSVLTIACRILIADSFRSVLFSLSLRPLVLRILLGIIISSWIVIN